MITTATKTILKEKPHRNLRLISIISVAALIVTLIIGGISAEFYYRSKAKDCLAQNISSFTGGKPKVSFSGKSVLLQYFNDKIDYVQLDSNRDKNSAEVHLRAEKITPGESTTKVGSLKGTVFFPYTRINELVTQLGQPSTLDETGADTTGGISTLLSNMKVTSLTGDPLTKNLSVVADAVVVGIFPVTSNIELKPEVTDGKLVFNVVKATAFGTFDVSTFAADMVDGMNKRMLPEFFNSIQFSDLDVTAEGLSLKLSGTNLTLTGDHNSGQGCSAL